MNTFLVVDRWNLLQHNTDIHALLLLGTDKLTHVLGVFHHYIGASASCADLSLDALQLARLGRVVVMSVPSVLSAFLCCAVSMRCASSLQLSVFLGIFFEEISSMTITKCLLELHADVCAVTWPRTDAA